MASVSRIGFSRPHSVTLHRKLTAVLALLVLVKMNDDGYIFGRARDVLFPLLLVDFQHLAEGGQLGLLLHLGHPLGAVLFHEVVLVEVEVFLGFLLELLAVHNELGVVKLVARNVLFEDLLRRGLLLYFGPIAHLNLDVFPFGGDAACHD
jgi:hypothetical protein